MTRPWLKIGGGGAALLGLGAAAFLLPRQFGEGAQPPAPKKEAAVRVYVVRPQEGGVERSVTRPASVHAFQYADLYAKVSGYLSHQVVDRGDRVTKGEVLARIAVPEVVAGVAKARADLKKAQALLAVAEARRTEAEAEKREAAAKVEQSKADVASAGAMVELRKRQYNRIKALAESQSVEPELVDEKLQARQAAEATERSTRQSVATAEAGVAAAASRVKRAEADVEDARAQVGVAEAQLQQAQAFEEYTRVRAPFDGVVTRRNYHEGDFIRDAASGGAGKPVLSVARTDKMRVITWVPDLDVPYTRRGEPATLRVDSLGGRDFKGAVARTASSEDYQSRTMRTEMDLENPDGLLTDGMYGRMTIDLGKSRNGLTVPSSCLSAEGKNDERTAFVVRDGKARRVTVQVGLDDGIRAEALSGLKPDDEVISQHGPGLTDGIPVQVVRPEP